MGFYIGCRDTNHNITMKKAAKKRARAPKRDKTQTVISVSLPVSLLGISDRIAKKDYMTRTQYITKLMFEDAEKKEGVERRIVDGKSIAVIPKNKK